VDLHQQILLQLRAEGQGEVGAISAEMTRLSNIMKGFHDMMVAGNVTYRDYLQTIRQSESEYVMLGKRLTELVGAQEAVAKAAQNAADAEEAAAIRKVKVHQEVVAALDQLDSKVNAVFENEARAAAEASAAVTEAMQRQTESILAAQAAIAEQAEAEERAAVEKVRAHQQVTASLDQLDSKVNAVFEREKREAAEASAAVTEAAQRQAESIHAAEGLAAELAAAEEQAAIQQVRSHQQIVASLDALDAKVNQVFDDEQREAAEAAAAEEQAALKQVRAHQQLMASMDSLNATINQTMEADRLAAEAANISTTEVFQRAREAQMAGAAAASGMKSQFSGLAMGMMQVGYMIDDIQYGFQAIVNNIAPLGMSIATAFGASIPQAQAFAATAQIAGVAAYQLYKNWDNLMDAMGTGRVRSEAEEMKELAKATERTADEEERLLQFKEREQAVKRQESMRPEAEEKSSKAFREAIAEGDYKTIKRGVIQTKRDVLINRPEVQPIVNEIAEAQEKLRYYRAHAETDETGHAAMKVDELEKQIASAQNRLQDALDRAAKDYLGEAENNTEGRRQEFMNAMRANLGAFGPHAASILDKLEQSTPEKIKEKAQQEKRAKAERWLDRRTKEDEEKMDQAQRDAEEAARENVKRAKAALPGAEILTQEAIRQRASRGERPEAIWQSLNADLTKQLQEKGFSPEDAAAAAAAINTEAGQKFGEQQARDVVQANKKEPKDRATEIKRHAGEAAAALMKNQGEGGLPMALARHLTAGESAEQISGALGPELRRQIGGMHGIPADMVDAIANQVLETLLGKEQRAGVAMGAGAHLEQMEGRNQRRGRQSQRQNDLEQIAEGMQQQYQIGPEVAAAMAPHVLRLINNGMNPLAASQMAMAQAIDRLSQDMQWLREHQFNIMHQMSGVSQRQQQMRLQNPPLLPRLM
jgi:hypothetical protein